jgi:hypothetical protein
MDVIGSLRDLPVLLSQARLLAWQAGKQAVHAWHCRSHGHLFLPGSSSQQDLAVSIPTNVWSPGPPAASLQGKWWLMAGDTDFL